MRGLLKRGLWDCAVKKKKTAGGVERKTFFSPPSPPKHIDGGIVLKGGVPISLGNHFPGCDVRVSINQ